MSAKIISLDQARKEQPVVPLAERSFQSLFQEARELRSIGPKPSPDELALVDWKSLRVWFQREMADEVFRRQWFNRDIIMSLCFVADLLLSFAKNEIEQVGIVEQVDKYTATHNPAVMLEAANAAFLMFVFWPEMRVRRSVRYRELAVSCGPSLYATYAGLTRWDMGYSLAAAFEPLGHIARECFAQA